MDPVRRGFGQRVLEQDFAFFVEGAAKVAAASPRAGETFSDHGRDAARPWSEVHR
jgi:hypothetical protein